MIKRIKEKNLKDFNSLKDTCSKCDKIWLYLIECMINSQKSFDVKENIKLAVEKIPKISSDPF